MNLIKIKCFCGEEFAFCEDNIPEGQTYEAECPACHAFIKRRKLNNTAIDNQPTVNVTQNNKPQIETTACPVCGKKNLRIGDYGERDIREEFRVICDSCDFCSKTKSSDYGEVFWEFMEYEYKKADSAHSNDTKEPQIIAWAKQSDGNTKITFSDGDTIFVNDKIFTMFYYEIINLSKEEIIKRFSSISNFKSFNKLVRDKIPQIIQFKGESCFFTTITDESQYFELLNNKLAEEVDEFLKEPSAEELADILEVVYSLAKHMGHTTITLEKIRQSKRRQRGGFDNKTFLNYTFKEKGDA